jgi:hypothetical protein
MPYSKAFSGGLEEREGGSQSIRSALQIVNWDSEITNPGYSVIEQAGLAPSYSLFYCEIGRMSQLVYGDPSLYVGHTSPSKILS